MRLERCEACRSPLPKASLAAAASFRSAAFSAACACVGQRCVCVRDHENATEGEGVNVCLINENDGSESSNSFGWTAASLAPAINTHAPLAHSTLTHRLLRLVPLPQAPRLLLRGCCLLLHLALQVLRCFEPRGVLRYRGSSRRSVRESQRACGLRHSGT